MKENDLIPLDEKRLSSIIMSPDISRVEKALLENPDFDWRWADMFGNNALMHACRFGWFDVAQFWVEKGLDVNLGSYMGDTPLSVMVVNRRLSYKASDYEWMVRNGANMHAVMPLKNKKSHHTIFSFSKLNNAEATEGFVDCDISLLATKFKGESCEIKKSQFAPIIYNQLEYRKALTRWKAFLEEVELGKIVSNISVNKKSNKLKI